jgi:hypothetical protein
MTRQELLQLAAEKAFKNSRSLLKESKLLYENEMYARSFALSVTAAEEYAKSFEYKCELAKFKIPPVPPDAAHSFRQARFALLVITPHLMAIGGWNFFAQMAGMKPKKPNRGFLEVFIKTFNHDIRGKRNRALYVDLNGSLSVPSEQITKKEARHLMVIMDSVLEKEPGFLGASGNTLQQTLGMGFLPLTSLDQHQLFAQIGKVVLKKND